MATTQVSALNGVGALIEIAAEQSGGSAGPLTLHSAPEIAGAVVSDDNPMPVEVVSKANLNPQPPNAFEVVTGGDAVIAFEIGAVSNGAWITNPSSAAGPIFVDPMNEPGTSAPGASGTTSIIYPGQSFTLPGPWPLAVRVNAVDSGHAFTAVSY